MESNGQRDRIHVSQSTADLLIKAGKADWVSPREELVKAKGKGLMQTFWVKPRSKEFTATDSSMNSSVRRTSIGFDTGPLGLGVPMNSSPERIEEVPEFSQRPDEEEDNLHAQLLDREDEPVLPVVSTMWGGERQYENEVEI